MVSTPTPFRMFPVRLENDLFDELDHFAQATSIPKTTIVRKALKKILKEFNETGVQQTLQAIYQHE